jgi:hypothetical protein
MATTTNYGFTVPTSADLVKNGATAISTLGSNLDAFLFRPFSRNVALNSSFNVWQRGTTGAGGTTAATGFVADRWQGNRAAAAAGMTMSRQVTGDTTNLPFIQYCARVQRDSGNTGTGRLYFGQGMETINSIPLAGKQVTFSFYARAGANYSSASSVLNYAVTTGTGTDQNFIYTGYTGSVDAIATTATLATTWQRFTATATLASTATEVGFQFYYTPVGTAGTNDYYEVTGVQLEVGSQASPYAPATPTYATELAACQRYYQVGDGRTGFNGYATTGTGAFSYWVVLPVQTRNNSATITLTSIYASGFTGTGTVAVQTAAGYQVNNTPTSITSNGAFINTYTVQNEL